MEKITNWRNLLPRMENSLYRYDEQTFRIKKIEIKEDVKKVVIDTSHRPYHLDFDSIETVLLKFIPVEGYNHLREAENPLPATINHQPDITPDERLESLTLEYLEKLQGESEVAKKRIKDLISLSKNQGTGATFSKNQAKSIIAAMNVQTKIDLNILNGLVIAKKLLDTKKRREDENPPKNPK